MNDSKGLAAWLIVATLSTYPCLISGPMAKEKASDISQRIQNQILTIAQCYG